MKIVFKLNSNNEYIGEHICQINPVEGGWLYPTYYTEIVPPEIRDNYKYIFNKEENSWEEIELPKIVTVWNKLTRQPLNCLNSEIPDECATIEPPQEEYYIFKDNNWIIDLELYREFKLKKISLDFENMISSGSFYSTTLEIEIDSRRNGSKNDLQNCQVLLSYIDRYKIEKITYKGKDKDKKINKNQLQQLIYEMEDYAMNLYQQKWNLENQIKNATTIEELNLITF